MRFTIVFLLTKSVGKAVGIESQGVKVNKYQSCAVGHYLSDWPEGLGFEELLYIMQTDDEELGQEIYAQERYEHAALPELAELICSMIDNLLARFQGD